MNENVINAKKVYSRIGLSYAAMDLLSTVILMVVVGVMHMFASTGKDMERNTVIIVNFAIRFLIIYPMMYLMIRRLPEFDIPKKRLGLGRFVACACVTYTIMYFSNILSTLLNSAVGKMTGKGGMTPVVDAVAGMSPIMQIIVVGILAPVFEELLFRKFLIDRVVNFGEVTAMIMSGVMFGLFHGNLSQFVYATFMGCFLAFVYIRTGRVGYTIALHIIVNGISTILTSFVFKGIDIQEMTGYLNNGDLAGYYRFVEDNLAAIAGVTIMGFFILILVTTGIILMIVNRKKLVFRRHPEEIDKGLRVSTVVLNTGMIFFILYCVTGVVLQQLGISM